MADKGEQYPEQETQERLSGILKGAFKGAAPLPKNTPKSLANQKSVPKSNRDAKSVR